MKRMLSCAVAVVMCLSLGASSTKSLAQGFHLQTHGLHVDVGRPHQQFYGGYASHYPSYWGGNHRTSYYGGSQWGRGHVWHDTTHLDYHPTEIIPHYNHYHVLPGHYDVHHSGHWDHLHH